MRLCTALRKRYPATPILMLHTSYESIPPEVAVFSAPPAKEKGRRKTSLDIEPATHATTLVSWSRERPPRPFALKVLRDWFLMAAKKIANEHPNHAPRIELQCVEFDQSLRRFA